MTTASFLHRSLVLSRRARILAERVARVCPPDATVLDVGCGDGKLARSLMSARPDVAVTGLDVLVRADAAIPVQWFDGRSIPLPPGSVDSVLLVDVVHHASDPVRLLAEAVRVARKSIIIKDHLCENWWDHLTLRGMDWVGNAAYGVALPYNYWSRARWREVLDGLGVQAGVCDQELHLYPWPFSLAFGRSLHFLSSLEPPRLGQRS
ncbi:MAG TPA: class I SAM-dependent methyltransferase [Gemmatimonadales bacterium]|nr:class I SAM-dependent methyltransferase [Gemmatimonadales bacterium]